VVAALLLYLPAELIRPAAESAAAAAPVAMSGHLSATSKQHQTIGVHASLQSCYCLLLLLILLLLLLQCDIIYLQQQSSLRQLFLVYWPAERLGFLLLLLLLLLQCQAYLSATSEQFWSIDLFAGLQKGSGLLPELLLMLLCQVFHLQHQGKVTPAVVQANKD